MEYNGIRVLELQRILISLMVLAKNTEGCNISFVPDLHTIESYTCLWGHKMRAITFVEHDNPCDRVEGRNSFTNFCDSSGYLASDVEFMTSIPSVF